MGFGIVMPSVIEAVFGGVDQRRTQGIRLDMGALCPAWRRLSEVVVARPAVQRALKIEGITIFEVGGM